VPGVEHTVEEVAAVGLPDVEQHLADLALVLQVGMCLGRR
jgi:hypothetical protein